MIPFALYGDDAKPDSPLQKIIAGAWGVPKLLSAAPTTANKISSLALNGDSGYFGTTLYINLGGTIYSLALTAV